MRKLHRSRRTKLLGGVAAGFAEYFGMDVTVMRLLFALLAVTIPNAILAYILAWIIIPEEPLEATAASRETATANRGDTQMDEKVNEAGNLPPTAPKVSKAATQPDRNRQLFGYILIFVGAIVLTRRFVPTFIWKLPSHLVGQLWPVLIILVGVALIFGAIRGR